MEEFLKIFSGTWVFDREENLRQSMEDMKMPPDDIDVMMKTRPIMTIDRQGDKILHRTQLAEGVIHDLVYELGGDKEVIAKDDKNDPPLFHNKVKTSFDGSRVKYIVESQLAGPRKTDAIIIMYIKNGELISETSPPKGNGEPDTSIIGTRVYKKKQ